MARVLEDMVCVVTLTDESGSPITTPEAAAEREAEIRQALRATIGADMAVEVKTNAIYRCEHCRCQWTVGEGEDNGCCDGEPKATVRKMLTASVQSLTSGEAR